jgi:sucrose-phosphate synthase
VDPHDQNAISDALLKLVSNKNLWQECRGNGLRHIHLYSWPEHCRTYLTRVAGCRIRNPRWLKDTPADPGAEEEFLEDSLMDVQDLSLRLSIDGEKGSLNISELASSDSQDQVQRIMNKMKLPSALPPSLSTDAAEATGGAMNKYPLLRRRRRLFVIAVDCYSDDGRASKEDDAGDPGGLQSCPI